MADTKLSDLTAITTPVGADLVYIVTGGNSRQVSLTNLMGQADDINTALVTLTGTQTLTNKTLTSPVLTTPQINDTSLDHQYIFAGSELTADRTITLPLLTAADEFVFKAHTQTLTNKTLTSPTITSGVAATSFDMNGTELIIDADADSSLTADTDDRFDFKLGGSDRFRMGTSDLDIVTATGNVTVAGADPKRGIYVPASAMYGATTSGATLAQIETTTNKVNVKVFDFDKDADESVHFAIPSPLYWDASTVTVTPYWTTTAGTTGTVVFSIQAMSFANDDALDQAYGTAVTSTDTFILASDLHIAPTTSAITVGGTPTAGDWIQFKILRDVSEDTLDADARLLGVRVTFGISQFNDA